MDGWDAQGSTQNQPCFHSAQPFPTQHRPNTPRFNTCMRSPWIVFWKQCPADPTTCGWDQIIRVGLLGPTFPLILFPSSPDSDCTLTSMDVFMK